MGTVHATVLYAWMELVNSIRFCNYKSTTLIEVSMRPGSSPKAFPQMDLDGFRLAFPSLRRFPNVKKRGIRHLVRTYSNNAAREMLT